MPGDSGSSRRAAMYGEDDLSSISIFSGNYINFGYWQDFTPGLISVGERTESQANLYRTVLRRLKIGQTDVALEVGCGIAVGAALALREFDPPAVHGLDLSQDQIKFKDSWGRNWLKAYNHGLIDYYLVTADKRC